MRAGLKFQFIALTITLVTITVFGSTYFFTLQEKEVLLREVTRRGSTIARNLATISTDSLIGNDHLALATFVSSIMKNEGIVYAMILNEKGIILAHSRIENVGKSYLEPQGVRPLTNEEILIQPFQDETRKALIDIALPIILRNGIRVGSVHIAMSQSAIDQYVNQSFRETLSIAAGLLLVGVIISIFITTFMLKPVGELMRGVKALGQGNLDYQIVIKGSSEFTVLGRAFNEMAQHLKGLYIGMLRAMAKALASRDPMVSGHDQRVAEYAAACAQHLGLNEGEIENIRLAGQVQNLGHIAVPDVVLQNTGKLSPEEYEQLKGHTKLGAEILNQVQALRGTVPLVLHHHERFDGTGYPQGLAGKNIPLGARILSVADAFDAMTSVQKHRTAIGREQALEEIKRSAGSQFDPEIVSAFVETMKSMQEKV